MAEQRGRLGWHVGQRKRSVVWFEDLPLAGGRGGVKTALHQSDEVGALRLVRAAEAAERWGMGALAEGPGACPVTGGDGVEERVLPQGWAYDAEAGLFVPLEVPVEGPVPAEKGDTPWLRGWPDVGLLRYVPMAHGDFGLIDASGDVVEGRIYGVRDEAGQVWVPAAVVEGLWRDGKLVAAAGDRLDDVDTTGAAPLSGDEIAALADRGYAW